MSEYFNENELGDQTKRPETLLGSTYKIKPPVVDHAIYITINDIFVYDQNGELYRRPYEVFLNSKNVEHFAHEIAITRLISAVFRKGGDCSFIIDELKSVYDPQGGYHIPKSKGQFAPSIIAHIGVIIENHMKRIGYLSDEVDEHMQAYLEMKRKEFEQAQFA